MLRVHFNLAWPQASSLACQSGVMHCDLYCIFGPDSWSPVFSWKHGIQNSKIVVIEVVEFVENL